MAGDTVFGSGISFPVRLGPDGRVAISRGPDNVRECIRHVLLTEPGERVMLPDFGGGAGRFLFEPNTVSTRRRIQERIEESLRRWEPRIALQGVAVEEDPDDPRGAIATVRYQLVADGATEQVSVAVQLAS
ncbi:MAG TPA: GPW/gp25 family protein [Longimicrobium sp.]|nr:GPW/gp25 family protein [Longimicrobium sp.]